MYISGAELSPKLVEIQLTRATDLATAVNVFGEVSQLEVINNLSTLRAVGNLATVVSPLRP